jgi:hypothetical protein
MKKAIFTILQLVLFLLVFGGGSLFPPFHLQHVLSASPTVTRIFIVDGLLLMFAIYLVFVLVEVLMKRLRTAVPWTTLALILATILGFMMKFGFLTRSAY